MTHPKVSNAAVVKMPDPILGEKACAYVVTKPGQEFTFTELVSFLEGQDIAPYKLPERLEIVSEFPMSSGQKVSKKELIADITKKLKAEGRIP